MNSLKRAMGMPSSRQVYRDANAVWQSQTIPYLGSEIPQVGVSEWDFETYFADQIKIQHPEDHKYAGDRRGIHDQSMYNNLFGVARVGFDLMTCDIIGNNPYFVLCETIVCNYLRSLSSMSWMHLAIAKISYMNGSGIPTPSSLFGIFGSVVSEMSLDTMLVQLS